MYMPNYKQRLHGYVGESNIFPKKMRSNKSHSNFSMTFAGILSFELGSTVNKLSSSLKMLRVSMAAFVKFYNKFSNCRFLKYI